MGRRFIVLFDTLLGLKVDEIGNLVRTRPDPRTRTSTADVVIVDSGRRSKFSVREVTPEIFDLVPAAQFGPRERSRLSFTNGHGSGRIRWGRRGGRLGQAQRNSADADPHQE